MPFTHPTRPSVPVANRRLSPALRLGFALLMIAVVASLWTARTAAEMEAAAGISLGTLDGPDGYRLAGAAEGNQTGKSLLSAGDVNGDGLEDFIIGAANADPGGRKSAGVSYLIYGRTDNPTGLSLGSLTASLGSRLVGGLTGDQAGESVGAAGDVNGDGYDDLIIGAPGLDSGETEDTGGSYVVFGAASLPGAINLEALNGANGFRVLGKVEAQRAGSSVGGGGDVNGDGYDDVILGAPDTLASGKEEAGAAYVIFGAPSFEASLDLSGLDGESGFQIQSASAFVSLGNAVASAGDVNRDGYDDVLVAAWKSANGSNDEAGVVYLLYGRASFAASISVNAIKGTTGFRMAGAAEGDHTGRSVAGQGDVNGDGFGDVVIGAPHATDSTGVAYVIFGKQSFPDVVNLGSLNGSDGFRLSGSDANGQAGTAVSASADVNGDGLDDVLIGAPGAGSDSLRFAGEAYVVFGKNAFQPVVSLGNLGGGAGLQYNGIAGGNQAGQAVAAAGDANGDGYDDLLIGEPKAGTTNANDVGFVYLVHGGGTMGITLPTTHPGTAKDDNLTGSAGSDVMVAGRGADTVDGQSGNDVLKGAAGPDVLIGRGGADRLLGGTGRDAVMYAGSPAGVTVNLFTGIANGGDASGDILGDIEDIFGSGLSDVLTGDTGANRIAGAAGNDTLDGGLGDDRFLFVPGVGQDTIMSFVAGADTEDLLDFSGYAAVESLADLAISQQGPDTRIGLPDGGEIVLAGVQSAALHPDDFRFGTAPIARRDRYATAAGTVLVVATPGVLLNDETNVGGPMTAVLVKAVQHGTLSLKPDGSFTYMPAPGFLGKDRFTYRANNGSDSNVATVILTVTPTPPIARADKFNAGSGHLLQVAVPGVLGNDVSPGGTPLTAVLITSPVYGTLTFNPNGSFSYLAKVDDNVIDSFTYQAVSTLPSAETTVTIEVFKDAGPFDESNRLPLVLRP